MHSPACFPSLPPFTKPSPHTTDTRPWPLPPPPRRLLTSQEEREHLEHLDVAVREERWLPDEEEGDVTGSGLRVLQVGLAAAGGAWAGRGAWSGVGWF